MWCAIALGALVRGCPVEHVESYVDLAQESLATFRDQANLDTAR
ncbi:hypothetical protein Esi_0339_0036 [Ectocarpus siliculosus]|uniref:Uncharacterized protein n=1 Tax=Ectocarpus siliculosus TaxID=2880 RepID=D7FY45_ECTSI|nr:hypothetical protein Esi_0339_0036 [Ectocarpus siliculosus]|eukprot:CBJ32458.1 hypothetical protein Esi_0339_0036 [Ectocarpus siliculosus]